METCRTNYPEGDANASRDGTHWVQNDVAGVINMERPTNPQHNAVNGTSVLPPSTLSHQPNCMHNNPVYNANNSQMNCHHGHCQHRCPRAMQTSPIPTNPIANAFGNLNINSSGGLPTTNIPMMPQHFSNPMCIPNNNFGNLTTGISNLQNSVNNYAQSNLKQQADSLAHEITAAVGNQMNPEDPIGVRSNMPKINAFQNVQQHAYQNAQPQSFQNTQPHVHHNVLPNEYQMAQPHDHQSTNTQQYSHLNTQQHALRHSNIPNSMNLGNQCNQHAIEYNQHNTQQLETNPFLAKKEDSNTCQVSNHRKSQMISHEQTHQGGQQHVQQQVYNNAGQHPEYVNQNSEVVDLPAAECVNHHNHHNVLATNQENTIDSSTNREVFPVYRDNRPEEECIPTTIRNKREISKGLTEDSAKNLIYFQNTDTESARTEPPDHRRKMHQHPNQSINTTQSMTNFHQHQYHNQNMYNTISAKKLEGIKEENLQPESPENETKATKVTYAGEEVIMNSENQVKALRVEHDKGTGDNSIETRQKQQHTNDNDTIGDCFKLRTTGKDQKKISSKDETKRRNGLE